VRPAGDRLGRLISISPSSVITRVPAGMVMEHDYLSRLNSSVRCPAPWIRSMPSSAPHYQCFPAGRIDKANRKRLQLGVQACNLERNAFCQRPRHTASVILSVRLGSLARVITKIKLPHLQSPFSTIPRLLVFQAVIALLRKIWLPLDCRTPRRHPALLVAE